jgi:uncharacterized cupredoxin-like copper-binding protein
MISRYSRSLIFCALFAISGEALANGTHSTGHGHDNETIGMPGKDAQVNRTVNIEMNDEMRFIPDNITVKQGETVRFKLKNIGNNDHEFVLGTEQELKNHNELMQRFPEMEHDEPNMITVAPGKTGEVVWHFTQNGKVNFACLIPGHFDAGMKGVIKVFPAKMPSHNSKSDKNVNHNH